MTINIALTSYPKRITNCVSVINSVLDNTIPPDRVYLTLSHLEFPDYERSLPQDLFRLIMLSNKVVLNWVEDNTKSMKKVFPILPYLEDDDIIIDIDDDMLIPKDFIAARLQDFQANGSAHPITSNLCRSINMDNQIMSAYSLFQKKMLNGYEKILLPEVLKTCNDDRTYLYLCHLNGYKLVSCTKYCTNRDSKTVQRLPLAPHTDYQYDIGPRYDAILAPVIARLSGGKRIGECFGLFSQPQILDEIQKFQKKEVAIQKKVEEVASKLVVGGRNADDESLAKPRISSNIEKTFQYNLKKPLTHDLVYVLGRGSKHSNIEIKISITSMLKFCSDWIGTIYVVGENPRISNPKVKHIYVPDITKTNKDANIIYKILTAINKIPTLSENFLFCSDDILVTKKTRWEDFSPRYVFEYNQDEQYRRRLFEKSRNNEWDKLLLKTLDRFIGYREHIYFYEPHIHAPINKRLFKQMCKQIDYTKERNVMIMSLWFNWLNLKDPLPRFDHQSVFSTNIPDLSHTERHLTYNDKAFSMKKFRDQLITLVTMDEFR